ncbi:hypothetical protein FACS1894162_1880 [Bacteroidia bacterium]|nr:hypothetical protein FACS1894162_1880 [Bacteroidia bacterium]
MKMKKVILMTLLLVGAVSVNAQVRIGGTTAAEKAILDLNASNTATNATQGLALPRAASKPAAPSIDGVLIYSAGDVYVSKSNAWEKLGSGTKDPDPNENWVCGVNYIVGSNSYTTALQGDGSCWMTENLREIKYADGTDLNLDNAGYQYPDKVEANVATMGLLYSWAAATYGKAATNANETNSDHDPVQGVCPNGWHLPSDKEFTTTFAATVPAEWPVAVFPGVVSSGTPTDFGTGTFYWSSSSAAGTKAWVRYVYSTASSTLASYGGSRSGQFSVRCKQD